MELEAINNKLKYGYIYIIHIMNLIYIGSGEIANDKNRLDKHLYEVFYKIKEGEPLTRRLFKAINQFILDFLYSMTSIKYHLLIS